MSKKRYIVIFLLFILTMITFMDRICISTASDLIMDDLKISSQTMGYIFAAFALSYALFQVPSGWIADTIGPKPLLAYVVSFWSLFTALTGAAWNAFSLIIFRFLFGAGEAGAFPGATRAVYSWVPEKERGLANGIFHSGGRVGAALSLVFMPWLIDLVGWRWMFVINGLIGVLWIITWILWFRDNPKDHFGINEKELRYIEEGRGTNMVSDEKIPLGIIITSSNMAFALFQYFASGVTYFISLSWLFPYMKSQWGDSATVYTPIPLLVGMLAHWTSGLLITFIYSKGLHIASRKIPAIIGFILSVIGLVLCTQIKEISALEFILFFSIAIFGVEMTIAPSWTFCIDIGGTSSGVVSGTMNMIGNIGSAVSAVIFPLFVAKITIPYFAETSGTANSFFILAASLNLLAIVAWSLMNPRKKFETNVSKRVIRLRLIVFIVLLVTVFIGFFIYKTFFMN